MLRLTCPNCRKDSYSIDVESFNACICCGFRFSGKYGPDKRCETRVQQEIPFAFSHSSQDFKAVTFDLSEKGLGIRISGDAHIAIGDVLNLSIGGNSIMAKVMWLKRFPDRSLAGLKRLN
jgi:hypothetical protein